MVAGNERDGFTPEDAHRRQLLVESFSEGFTVPPDDIFDISIGEFVVDMMSVNYFSAKNYELELIERGYSHLDQVILASHIRDIALRQLNGYVDDVEDSIDLSGLVAYRLREFEQVFIKLLKKEDPENVGGFLGRNPKFQEAIGGRPNWLAMEG